MLLSESSRSEKATYSIISTMRHLQKAKHGDSKNISDCHGFRVGVHRERGEMSVQDTEEFYVMKLFLYNNGGYISLCICQNP